MMLMYCKYSIVMQCNAKIKQCNLANSTATQGSVCMNAMQRFANANLHVNIKSCDVYNNIYLYIYMVCVTDKIIIYNLVLLCLGLSEVAQNLHNRQGPALYRYHPIPAFVIPPGRLKSSEPIGDDPNLCMALHLAHSFVRYSCIYIYIHIIHIYIYLYIVIRISCQVCLTHHHFANCW